MNNVSDEESEGSFKSCQQSPHPRTPGNDASDEESEGSFESCQQQISLGIPSKIAGWPRDILVKVDVTPFCKQGHEFGADRPDLTTILDGSFKATVVVDKLERCGVRDVPPGAEIYGGVVDVTEHGNDPTSKYFRSLPS